MYWYLIRSDNTESRKKLHYSMQEWNHKWMMLVNEKLPNKLHNSKNFYTVHCKHDSWNSPNMANVRMFQAVLTLQCWATSILAMHNSVLICLYHEWFWGYYFIFASFCRHWNGPHVQVKICVQAQLFQLLFDTDFHYKFLWTPRVSILNSQLLCCDLL